MNQENLIAYEGIKYVIEWYVDQSGKSQALAHYQQQTMKERIKIMRLFKKMADFGEILSMKHFRYEGKGIYAFKPRPDRYLCFFYRGKRLIITNAFTKKQQKLPAAEKARAIKYKKMFEKNEAAS